MATRDSRASLVVGVLLILLGGLFLLQQLFDFDIWGWLWPFLVIGAGGLFFAGMFAGGRSAAPLAIPGSIITTIGLILLFGNLTDHWEVWAYAWALIVMAVGAGLAISGWWGQQPGMRRSGLALARLGLVLFASFGAFFELVIFNEGPVSGYVGPLLLIGLGLYLLISRAGLWRRPASASGRPASETVIEGEAREAEDERPAG